MNTKKVYLTIDDAPSKDFIDKVNYLYSNDISSVFFCVGENMLKYEDDVVYAINKGFIIGNHSFSHRYFSDMSFEECSDSIIKTDLIIERLYKKSNFSRVLKIFRFPYFDQGGFLSHKAYEDNKELLNFEDISKKEKIQQLLKKLGYVYPNFKGINMKYFSNKIFVNDIDIKCTFDQKEYFLGHKELPSSMNSEQPILNRIEEDLPFDGKALNCYDTSDIILLHDHDHTTKLFYKIIDRYLEKKFIFLKL